MRNRVHIAVLEADTPSPAVYAKRGLYNTQFRKLLSAAADRLNQNVQNLKQGPIDILVTAFDVVGGSFPDLHNLRAGSETSNGTCPIDAILVTGAVAAAYDDLHWIPALESFIQTVHNKYPIVKIFGSCFGHQLIGQALLEKSESSYIKEWPTKFSVQAQSSHEIGVQSRTLNPNFACRFSSLASFKQMEPFRIQLIHGDVVAPSTTPIEGDRMNALFRRHGSMLVAARNALYRASIIRGVYSLFKAISSTTHSQRLNCVCILAKNSLGRLISYLPI